MKSAEKLNNPKSNISSLNWFSWLNPFCYFVLICLISSIIFIWLDFNDPSKKWRALYLLIVIVITWIFNYVDIVIVGLFPLILGPVLLIMPLEEIFSKYITTTTLLYTTASLLGGAFQKHGLDRRFALAILQGSSHQMFDITWRFVIIAGFISMWISDTATMTLLIPILEKMLILVEEWHHEMNLAGNKDPRTFKPPASNLNFKQLRVVCYLVLAYTTCIGGMATMIGSTTNFAFLSQFNSLFPNQDDLTFAIWFAYAIPMAIIIFFSCWFCAVLSWEGPTFTYRLFKYIFQKLYYFVTRQDPNKDIPGVKEYLKSSEEVLERSGKWSFAETILTAIFPIVIILLFLRDPGIPGFGGWNSIFSGPLDNQYDPSGNLIEINYTHDSMVTTFFAILAFMLPAHSSSEIHKAMDADPANAVAIKKKMTAERIINWKEAASAVEWGVMWIFGGGFAIAEMITRTGLSVTIADGIGDIFQNMNSTTILLMTCIVGSIFTEFMSSTNVLNILTPVLSSVAMDPRLCINPLFIAYNAVFTGAHGALFPISTTSNVLAYKAANVTIPQMFRTGLLFKLSTIFIVFFCVMIYGNPLLGMNTFPWWAQDYINKNMDPPYNCMAQ